MDRLLSRDRGSQGASAMMKAFEMTRSRRAWASFAVVIASVSFGRCGGGGSANPAQPPVTVPATPTPAPTPVADPPLSASCAKLPPGNPNAACRIEPSDYLQIVERSIRTLQAEQSAIFDGDQVLSTGQYYVGLIKILDRQGICAVFDGEELAVTDRPTSNEQFHVLTSAGRARFGPQSYRTTCSPSVIPVVPGALPPSPTGCTLPSSREVACGRDDSSRYINDVTAAIEQVLKEQPDLFNYGDTAAGTGWPAVKNLAAYHGAVVQILTKKGYCAIDDGEEIAVKQGSNSMSEQFDINFQDKYIRLGQGIYRASCFPAAF
jgi:hypothetical protein